MSEMTVDIATFDFEATGFVASRRQFNALVALSLPSPEDMFLEVRHMLSPFGITGVSEVFLSEDDAQANTEIKVFVVVKLLGPHHLANGFSATRVAGLLEDALTRLATHVCCNKKGADKVGPENWEFANDYEFC